MFLDIKLNCKKRKEPLITILLNWYFTMETQTKTASYFETIFRWKNKLGDQRKLLVLIPYEIGNKIFQNDCSRSY